MYSCVYNDYTLFKIIHIFRQIQNPNDHILQADIKNLILLRKTWLMQFHPDKCQLLKISNKKTPSIHRHIYHTQQSSTYNHLQVNAKYLGVTINNKLSWNTHIDIVSLY